MSRKEKEKQQRAQFVEENGVICLKNVTKSYSAGAPALNDVSLSIKKGEFVFIVGDSGSGKSTLIKLLLRELTATDGGVYVMGQDLAKLKHRKVPKFRRHLGVVFQDFRLLNDRNVFENVAFAQRIVEAPYSEIRRKVPEILATVGLAGKYRAKTKQLSGGEQQRVALARALVNDPDILLADEPTGNLDPKNSWEIMHLLEEINSRGTTVVVVTHNAEIVNSMKKRVIMLQRGEVMYDEEGGEYIDVEYVDPSEFIETDIEAEFGELDYVEAQYAEGELEEAEIHVELDESEVDEEELEDEFLEEEGEETHED